MGNKNRHASCDHEHGSLGYLLEMISEQRGKHYLREWREFRGLSLRQLANRIEIAPGEPMLSHASIGRIETGETPYSQDFMEAAARELGVTVADLLTRDPRKEGEVVDLVRLIQEKDREQAIRVLKALNNAAG